MGLDDVGYVRHGQLQCVGSSKSDWRLRRNELKAYHTTITQSRPERESMCRAEADCNGIHNDGKTNYPGVNPRLIYVIAHMIDLHVSGSQSILFWTNLALT